MNVTQKTPEDGELWDQTTLNILNAPGIYKTPNMLIKP